MNRLADYLSLHLLRKTSIRFRLAGACVLLSLLPLVLAGVAWYAGSTRAVAAQARLLSTEVARQVARNVGLEMARLEADSEALVLSDRVQGALVRYAGGDEAQVSAARRELTLALLERYGSFGFINQKYLLDRDNRIIDTQVFSSLGRGVVGFVERAPKLAGRPYWGAWNNAAGQKSLVLLRAIHNKADNQSAGSLFLGVRPSHFAAIFDDVDLGSGSAVFVLDADAGSVVAKMRGRPDAAPDAALAEELRRSLQRNERSGVFGASGRPLAAYAQVADTGWFVVATIPLATLAIEAQSVRDTTILIGLAALAGALVLALLLARSISAPLARLAHGMRAAEGGHYAHRVAPEGRDELTVLARQFNEMAGQVGARHLQLEACVSERTRDLAEADGKLAELSMTDGLTGIADRRRFDEVLVRELQRAARARAPLALLMLDVDYFKAYNDCYGHPQGDACLRRLAALLQSHGRRAGDLAARYGGAQFVLVASSLDTAGALALAGAIRAEFEALGQPHERSPLGRVTASIGVVALVPDLAAGEQAGASTMLRMAGEALRRAKERGRNQVVLARAAALP